VTRVFRVGGSGPVCERIALAKVLEGRMALVYFGRAPRSPRAQVHLGCIGHRDTSSEKDVSVLVPSNKFFALHNPGTITGFSGFFL